MVIFHFGPAGFSEESPYQYWSNEANSDLLEVMTKDHSNCFYMYLFCHLI